MTLSRRSLLKHTGLLGLGTGLAGTGLTGCAGFTQAPAGLKDLYAADFTSGAAINADIIRDQDPFLTALIKREFNSITPENCMKWERIRTAEEGWDFADADAFVAFGQANNMEMVGHTLIWHSQVPDAVFYDAKGNYLTPGALNAKIDNHISTLVARYKGKLAHWDVVNEVIGDDFGMRKSHWYNILGDSFIERAFKLTHEIDPSAHLVYNDYNIEYPEKRAATLAMLKRELARGTPIQGVGIQGHINLQAPLISEIEKSIIAFSELGLRVHVTELDVDVLPLVWDLPTAEISTRFDYTPARDPYRDGMPQAIKDQLARRYEDLYRVFSKHADKIDRVTLWGVSDDATWLNDFPIKGRTSHPLLFDRNKLPKEAYLRVAALKR